ncbi:TPA: PrsW family intramembrane metalloprotease, partial [Streptococcus pyogenes]|nr:PrsW family intramembrane metalloprotease [Streptococcus pyogenes]
MALVLNGIELELLGLTANNLSFKEAFALILTISLLGIYLIPFAAAI